MKVEIVRSVIGNYDDIIPIKKSKYNIKKLNISSKKEASYYLDVCASKLQYSNQLISRYIKFSDFSSKADIKVWIDGNIYMETLDQLIYNFAASDALVAVAKHPLRFSLKDELKACLMGKKINMHEYKHIKSFLDLNDDNLKNLCQSGVMLRKKSAKVDQTFIEIRVLLEKYAPRDQLFMMKIFNKHKIPVMLYNLDEYPIKITRHKTSFYKRLIKKLNYNFFKIVFKLKIIK